MNKLSIILLLLMLGGVLKIDAQNLNVLRKKHFNLSKGVAIDGYDPVAYFTTKKAVKGNKSFSYNYGNAIYYFTNETNLKMFIKSPNSFEPQYGGWCAYAMGNAGDKVEVDPETFKVLEGKLYLFYNKYLTNTLKTWNKDEPNLKLKADKNWVKTFQ